MLELGGNIYFTAKLGATDGHSFQHIAAVMTGSTQEDYAEMMLERRPLGRGQPQQVGQIRQARQIQTGQIQTEVRAADRGRNVARIIAGVSSSHVPAIGAAIDNKRPRSPIGSGCSRASRNPRSGWRRRKPDVVIFVYNDHASAFSVEIDPDLRARLRGRIPARRRGLGPAPGAGGERATPSSPRISPSRSSSTSSISPSSTRWRSITASPCR